MSKNGHTPEPWRTHDGLVFFPDSAGGFSLQNCPSPEANARRIVACVNACEGIENEWLEINAGMLQGHDHALERERDVLKEQLEFCYKVREELETALRAAEAMQRWQAEALEEAASFVERAPNASVAILAKGIRTLLAKHGR